MSTTMRNAILAVIAILIVGGGVYFIFKKPSTTPPREQQTAATTDKVEAQDVSIGTGLVAKPGDKVAVLYEGKFQNGTVFDSSAMHNNQPLVFTLGVDQLIPGFQIGVNGMKEGGERMLLIPPSLGYGSQDTKDPTGKVIIPANSTLLFSVKLVKVQPGTTTPAAR